MRPQKQPLGYVAADKRRGEGMDAASGWPRRLAPHGLPRARWVMADGEVLGLALVTGTAGPTGREGRWAPSFEAKKIIIIFKTLAQVSI